MKRFFRVHAKATTLLMLLWVAFGVFAIRFLPRSLYPELSFPRAIVVATTPDATAQIMLLNVTRPLEEALMPIFGVRRVRSKTIRGATEIVMQFDADVDMVVALNLIQSRLADVAKELPKNTNLSAERITPISFPVFTLNVEGSLPPEQLHNIALYVVRPALLRVPGVGPVTVTAGYMRSIEVEVKPERAEAAGITLEQIVQRLGETQQISTIGRLDRSYRRYSIVLTGQAQDIKTLGEIVIGGTQQVPIRLTDVALIHAGHEDPRLSVSTPRGEAAVINVARRIGGDAVALNQQLTQEVSRLQTEMPVGVFLTPVYDQATLIGSATQAVGEAIVLGMILSSLVLLLFLRDSRATLISMLSIPASLLAACAAIYLCHDSFNLMSLGGMAIATGLVIDDAVVVIEAIYRQRALGVSVAVATEQGVDALFSPVVSSTVTTVVVFMPLALLSGVVGHFFMSLSTALTAAVIASLLIALTIVPWIARTVLQPSSHEVNDRITPYYAGLLSRVLYNPKRLLIATLMLIGLGVIATFFLETDFIPEMDEGTYVIDYFAPIGTSLKETATLLEPIDQMLRDDPDVETFTRRLGSELGPPRATETSRGDYVVRLKPKRKHTVFEIMESQRAYIASRVPGVRIEMLQLLQDMLGDLEGTPEPIELKIFGEDESELRHQAKVVAEKIAPISGIVDLFDGQIACSPERVVQLDPVAMGRAGLTTQNIADQLQVSLLGVEATTMPEHDRLIDVRVRWPNRDRFDAQALERARVHTPSGAWFLLNQLATIHDHCVSSEINRENLRLMVPVTARIDGRSLGSVVSDVEQQLKTVTLPAGYSIELGGQRVSQHESFQSLFFALGFALCLVILVLTFQFGNFSAPLSILCAIPIALAAGVLTLAVTRVELNISSLLGGILLVGLAVKNGILLLEYASMRERAGQALHLALVEAGQMRLRPVLMTTLCTVVGLLPLALGLGTGADMHRPLAVAVIGGLLMTTLATLFVVPSVFLLIRKRVLKT